MTVKGDLCKLETCHATGEERIIETKNEINIPWLNSLVREWSKRMNRFDCKNLTQKHKRNKNFITKKISNTVKFQ